MFLSSITSSPLIITPLSSNSFTASSPSLHSYAPSSDSSTSHSFLPIIFPNPPPSPPLLAEAAGDGEGGRRAGCAARAGGGGGRADGVPRRAGADAGRPAELREPGARSLHFA